MTTPTLVIRERTHADLPAAADALVEVHRTDGYPVEGVADPTAWLTGAGQIRAWVGELDGRIVGHVAISAPTSGDAAASMWTDTTSIVAVLGRLFVTSAARGHSVGRRLVEAAQDDARRQGVRLVLDVMTKDASAIALYERLGWRRIGETNHGDGTGRTIPALAYVSPA